MGRLAQREVAVQELPVEHDKTEAWTFALAGVIAVFIGPVLAEVAGAHELIFMALTFGGAVGVLDTIGV